MKKFLGTASLLIVIFLTFSYVGLYIYYYDPQNPLDEAMAQPSKTIWIEPRDWIDVTPFGNNIIGRAVYRTYECPLVDKDKWLKMPKDDFLPKGTYIIKIENLDCRKPPFKDLII